MLILLKLYSTTNEQNQVKIKAEIRQSHFFVVHARSINRISLLLYSTVREFLVRNKVLKNIELA